MEANLVQYPELEASLSPAGGLSAQLSQLVGSGSRTVTENGTYDVRALAQMIVNVPGGLDFETGTWTPAEDVARGEIAFARSHDKAPMLILVMDKTGTADTSANSMRAMVYADLLQLGGCGIDYSPSADTWRYALALAVFRSSSITQLSTATTQCAYSSEEEGDDTSASAKYWAESDRFYPYGGSSSRYWRTGRTYAWIAVWKG